MFRIEAPHPGYHTTIVLPSPSWGDSVELRSTMSTARAMDGTVYSYVKQKGGKKRLHFDFTISRNKALELRAFIKVYYRYLMKIVDYNNEQWIVSLQNNPFEFAGDSRAEPFPGKETMTITLEFEEH